MQSSIFSNISGNKNYGVRTSVVGSQPLPPNGFLINKVSHGKYQTLSGEATEDDLDFMKLVLKQAENNIRLQDSCGLDLLSEGEIFRNDPPDVAYRTNFIGSLGGVARKPSYNSQYKIEVTSQLEWKESFYRLDWQISQLHTQKPVKINIPGPLTASAGLPSTYYKNQQEIAEAFILPIRKEIEALSAAGCRYIQIDDPALITLPEDALNYGIDFFREVIQGFSEINFLLHICWGNTYTLESKNSRRDWFCNYWDKIIGKLNDLPIAAYSIEAKNHREAGFKDFSDKTILLGVVDVMIFEAESPDVIAKTAEQVLKDVPPHRLFLTPICGMKHMPPILAIQKMQNLVEATRLLNNAPASYI